MNKKQRMNEQILQHGFDLKRAFYPDPYAANLPGPVELCKKLHRLEVKAHRLAERYCSDSVNQVTEEELDKMTAHVIKRLGEIFGPEVVEAAGMHINWDPRGYALKTSEQWAKAYTDKGESFYRDWGGYGILAPEFDGSR